MENYGSIDEPNAYDDGSPPSPNNCVTKDDGRSRNPKRNARNAKKYGKYAESGNGILFIWVFISHSNTFVL